MGEVIRVSLIKGISKQNLSPTVSSSVPTVNRKSGYESLFRVWGTAWGTLWKAFISPLFSMPVNPWGATKLNKSFRINKINFQNRDSNWTLTDQKVL